MINEEELLQELEKLDREEFMIEMDDHWTHRDFERIDEIHKRQREIKQTLKDIEQAKESNCLIFNNNTIYNAIDYVEGSYTVVDLNTGEKKTIDEEMEI